MLVLRHTNMPFPLIYQKIYLFFLLPETIFFFFKNIYCIIRKTFEKSQNLCPCPLSSSHSWQISTCILQRKFQLLSGSVVLASYCINSLILLIFCLICFHFDQNLNLSFANLMSMVNLSSFLLFFFFFSCRSPLKLLTRSYQALVIL